MRGRYERKFMKEIGNISDVTVFMGVARILKVNPMKDKDTPKDFTDVLMEVINAYFATEPKRQRELLKILKDANKCKEKEGLFDGYNTEDTAETGSNEEV